MAQLDKAPNGMTLGELSQRMMVSNGNVTGLAERLVEQGLLDRRAAPNDRRAQIVSLTAEGRRAFRAMARTHEDWIARDLRQPRRRRDRAADGPAGEDQSFRAQSADRTANLMMPNPVTLPLSDYQAQHVRLTVDGKVATLTLNRPDKKNPLTFESYAEIANIFRAAAKDKQVKAFVITGEGGNFCSGGDVFEIIGPLVEMNTVDLLEFTRMTGEAVKAMRALPAADRRGDRRRLRRRGRDPRDGLRPAPRHRQGQGRVPVQSCRPRRLRHGRLRDPAAHHRAGPRSRNCSTPAACMGGEEAERWGFFNRLCAPEAVLADAHEAREQTSPTGRPSPTP